MVWRTLNPTVFSDPQKAESHWQAEGLSCFFSPWLSVLFLPIRARDSFTDGDHREAEREQRANRGSHDLSKHFLQAVLDYESRQSVAHCHLSFTHTSSPQRPYVMRSSTPATEILQTFQKVHPSYPASWSVEMKSLLRKVRSFLFGCFCCGEIVW